MINLQIYEKGEIILKENDSGKAAYIIEDGKVEVSKDFHGKKIILTYLGPGAVFGEMSIIDERPRSATITAIEKTSLKVIQGESFLDLIKNNQSLAIILMKSLFERLRESNVRIMQLEDQRTKAETDYITSPKAVLEDETRDVIKPDHSEYFEKKGVLAYMEGLNDVAINSLPEDPYPIENFPLLIGRDSSDPLVMNDLMIFDHEPFQISRHHVKIIFENNKLGAVDRCSTLGSIVDKKCIGGLSRNPGPIFFKKKSEGNITLGSSQSLLKYKIYLKI